MNSTSLPLTLACSSIIHRSEKDKKIQITFTATNSFNDHRSNVSSNEPVELFVNGFYNAIKNVSKVTLGSNLVFIRFFIYPTEMFGKERRDFTFLARIVDIISS